MSVNRYNKNKVGTADELTPIATLGRNRVWTGTKAAAEVAMKNGDIGNGTVVYITDDYDDKTVIDTANYAVSAGMANTANKVIDNATNVSGGRLVTEKEIYSNVSMPSKPIPNDLNKAVEPGFYYSQYMPEDATLNGPEGIPTRYNWNLVVHENMFENGERKTYFQEITLGGTYNGFKAFREIGEPNTHRQRYNPWIINSESPSYLDPGYDVNLVTYTSQFIGRDWTNIPKGINTKNLLLITKAYTPYRDAEGFPAENRYLFQMLEVMRGAPVIYCRNYDNKVWTHWYKFTGTDAGN